MPSMAASLQPSLAKILSILKVAKESLGGLFGPGWVSTPPMTRRTLLIVENMYNQHEKMANLYTLWSNKDVLWLQ